MRVRLGRPRITRNLLLLLLATLALVVAGNWWVESRLETDLLHKIEARNESLAVALQITLQELDAEHADPDLLDEYVQRLSEHGVRRIAILGAAREELASATSERPGDHRASLVSATLGSQRSGPDEAESAAPRDWAFDLPVVVNGEVRGYAHLNIANEDLRDLIRRSGRKRNLMAIGAFLAGIGGVTLISFWWTRELGDLSQAASRVAAGDLSVDLQSKRNDELGMVARTFDGMVKSLRERRDLEANLHRAEQMATAGLGAASVLHEVGNPLNYISLSVDHLARELVPSEPARAEEFRQLTSSLSEEVARLDHLLQDYRKSDEPLASRRDLCSLPECIDDVLTLVALRAQHQQVSIARDVDDELPAIPADASGLRSCVLNLVSNALQAMPAGGRLAVEAHAAGDAEQPAVVIRVRDTGEGITPEVRARLFDPYFTTHEGGLGLGLSITARIVRQHGGRIRLQSEPGKGSCFEIELPAPCERGSTA
jgi:signal transduction histidine kinase